MTMEKKNLSLSCTHCEKSFKNTTSLLSHTKWKHETVAGNQCEECGMRFLKRFNLKRHKEVVHKDNIVKKKSFKCSLCDFCAINKKIVYSHYQDTHEIVFNHEELIFKTQDEFHLWKSDIERETKSRFVKTSASCKRKNGEEVITFACHRDGNFISKSDNIRRLKIQGSNKINSHCPAKITAHITEGNIIAKYYGTHIGHTSDLSHLTLTKTEREAIAQRLAMKVPFQQILDEVRDSVMNSNLERIHLLNRKDLWNIVQTFELNHESVMFKNHNLGIEAWIAQMQSSSNTVRLYKPQGVLLEGYPHVKEEDFFIVIMNDAQLEILEKFGDDCICIDGSLGLNARDFQLFTLMVLDDMRNGFPCAFLFSNRGDLLTVTLFFETIKDYLGRSLSPKIFMSDIDDSFFNAWSLIMSPNTRRLYCSWNVDKAWRSNLNKIKGEEQQLLVYKKLKALMCETDASTFDESCATLFTQLNGNLDTRDFASYFEKFYNDTTTWAYCHSDCDINAITSLENMHKILRQICFDGEKTKRLDKAIYSLMKFIRENLLDKLVITNKEKVADKIKHIELRHKKADALTDLYMVEGENTWTIHSTQSTEICKVHRCNIECGCELRCNECDICIHTYHCTCLDSSVKWNMCEHVHLLCMLVKNNEYGENVNVLDSDNSAANWVDMEVVNEVEIIANDNGNETARDETEAVVPETSEITVVSLENRKKYALEKLLSSYNMIVNEKQLEAFIKATAPLENIIKELSNDNKNLCSESDLDPSKES